MTTRISINTSDLPKNTRLDVYQDGTAWLRVEGGRDIQLRNFAEELTGGERQSPLDPIVHHCSECGVALAMNLVEAANYIRYGEYFCSDHAPMKKTPAPDNGQRRRKTDPPLDLRTGVHDDLGPAYEGRRT